MLDEHFKDETLRFFAKCIGQWPLVNRSYACDKDV